VGGSHVTTLLGSDRASEWIRAVAGSGWPGDSRGASGPPSGGASPGGRLPITGVRIGPSTNEALNVGSAGMLPGQFGYAGIPVDCSNTPCRG
jgi:hypothetical protein